jgi:hypothetical protein
MPESKTYEGGCQCGAVRYEVTTDLSHVISCNCSICHSKGLVLAFAEPAQFRMIMGHDATRDYQFNKRVIHHLFCATCGVESFARGKKPDGSEAIAINVRCLSGADLDALDIKRVDGRSR